MSKPSITNCPNTFFIIVHSFNCIFSSLSCFACVQIRHTPLSGGYCGEVPPLPIPNREVKLTCADGTAMQCGRVGSRLLLSRASDFERFLRLFCFSHWFHWCSQIFPKSLHERHRKPKNILSINDLEDCVRKECWNNVEFRRMILIF